MEENKSKVREDNKSLPQKFIPIYYSEIIPAKAFQVFKTQRAWAACLNSRTLYKNYIVCSRAKNEKPHCLLTAPVSINKFIENFEILQLPTVLVRNLEKQSR